MREKSGEVLTPEEHYTLEALKERNRANDPTKLEYQGDEMASLNGDPEEEREFAKLKEKKDRDGKESLSKKELKRFKELKARRRGDETLDDPQCKCPVSLLAPHRRSKCTFVKIGKAAADGVEAAQVCVHQLWCHLTLFPHDITLT